MLELSWSMKIGLIAAGSLLLLSNFVDFSYIFSKVFFFRSSQTKEKTFIEIVNLWYRLKTLCEDNNLDIACEKLDEVFPLLNKVLEDE